SGCGSFMLLCNGDRGLAVDKAAQFFGLGGGNAKPKWGGRLVGTRVGRVWDGINGVAGVGKTNPARARLIFTGAETDAFTIFPSQNLSHFGIDPRRLFRRQFHFLDMILLEKLSVVDEDNKFLFRLNKEGEIGIRNQ